MSKIPLTPEAQRFRISLGDTEYILVVKWNGTDELSSLGQADALSIINYDLPIMPSISNLLKTNTDSNVYKIPLSPEAQYFNIKLGTNVLTLVFVWASHEDSSMVYQFWTLDILDSNGNKLVGGIPLVYDTDLLEQYDYLDFGGQLILKNDGTTEKTGPSYDSLGIDDNLYYIPNA